MRFYFLKEGQVHQESMFKVESVSKVPLSEGKTEWNFKSEKRQGLLCTKVTGELFGCEECAVVASQSNTEGVWDPVKQVFTLAE